MAAKLSPISAGVVHSSANRTRIKIPKVQRSYHNADVVKNALLTVPGVKDVQANPKTGSIIVEHEERADIIENIGEAIREVAPDLLTVLTATSLGSVGSLSGVGLKGLAAFGSILSVVLPDDRSREAKAANDGKPNFSSIKRIIPWAFLGTGLVQLIQGEALLAGVSPLLLIYLAFDSHWKFEQEAKIATLQADDSTIDKSHK